MLFKKTPCVSFHEFATTTKIDKKNIARWQHYIGIRAPAESTANNNNQNKNINPLHAERERRRMLDRERNQYQRSCYIF